MLLAYLFIIYYFLVGTNIMRTKEEKTRALVDQDIYCNCSHLISELMSNERYFEDIIDSHCKYDWEGVARESDEIVGKMHEVVSVITTS